MGYQTTYNLNVTPPLLDVDINEAFSTVCEFIDARPEKGYLGWMEGTWPQDDFCRELKEFSVFHPNHLFQLSAEGEECNDLWEAYFQAGKSQFCMAEITYPPYDPKEMK